MGISRPRGLAEFGGYTKARELFDLTVRDLAALPSGAPCQAMVAQQIASTDSIAANIEEGYGRGSKREFVQFLVIARGSAQETSGRFERFSHWLPAETIAARTALCGEIIGILSATIRTLRAQIGK
jgi:four helix bundle protein